MENALKDIMKFYPGFDIRTTTDRLGFSYGKNVFGPVPEIRRLDDIRISLQDPLSSGPEELYAIVMDVGLNADRQDIVRRNLLFGAVTYAAGLIGQEPVRSQGHIHAVSASCGSLTPEVYEIWEGEAVIYLQESGEDDPGKCYAVHAGPGDVVIVPPGYVHATINADVHRNMTFGAWCVRDYGFDYRDVRRHGGIAFFPYIDGDSLKWKQNPAYREGEFIEKKARPWEDFGLEAGVPIYTQFQEDKDRFMFVADPKRYQNMWKGFEP